MKVLSASDIRDADSFTIKNEPISSIDLMERAAMKCTEWISTFIEQKKGNILFGVFCGTGNNGGDGLAVSRLLLKMGFDVETILVHAGTNISTDNRKNLVRLKKTKGCKLQEIYSLENLKFNFNRKNLVIIDAIIGVGLNKPVSGWLGALIETINKSNSTVISIDIPSGMYADIQENNGHWIRADYTLAFNSPKRSFLFPVYGNSVGSFYVLDIGLDQSYIQSLPVKEYFIDVELIKTILKPRVRFSNKGTYGHGLLISGSKGKIGAAVLASKACMRSGIGKLTVHVPSCGYNILQNSVPEAMVDSDSSEAEWTDAIKLQGYSAVGVGPGIGTSYDTANKLKLLIQEISVPFIMDADALNILSENKTWLAFLPPGTVLTPHPKEFDRLIGESVDPIERFNKAKELALRFSIYIVLKDSYSYLVCPGGDIYFNSTGNSGMAKAGSGDVLSGIILSFLAQGYSSREACIISMYIHGLAGDIAANKISKEAMLSEDIISHLGEAFKTLL